MSLPIVLPARYAFVTLVGVASSFLTTWQGGMVGRQRKMAGIKYPQVYAEKAEVEANKEAAIFNNLQRAHQHTMETYPQFMICMFVTGLKYPLFAASLGGAWFFGRIAFTNNYRGGADQRNKGIGGLSLLSLYTIMFGAAWTVLGFFQPDLPF